MANDLNRFVLIGRLTRDPEIKHVGESTLCNFSIANGRSYKVNGEKRDETYYFDCELWGKLAEILKQYAFKGTQVMVEGKLKQSTWDGTDGKRSKVSIRVENFQLLNNKKDGQSSTPSNHSQEPQESPEWKAEAGQPVEMNHSSDDDIF
jgi:single-strand DNA-binding protein